MCEPGPRPSVLCARLTCSAQDALQGRPYYSPQCTDEELGLRMECPQGPHSFTGNSTECNLPPAPHAAGSSDRTGSPGGGQSPLGPASRPLPYLLFGPLVRLLLGLRGTAHAGNSAFFLRRFLLACFTWGDRWSGPALQGQAYGDRI